MKVCTECNQEFEDHTLDINYFICEECLIDIE